MLRILSAHSIRKSGVGLLMALLLTFSLIGCTSKSADGGSETTALTECAEPRPQVCTMDYRPVCGQDRDGAWKTYSNACGACSDATVLGHRPGSCEDSK